jgi:hypothetical protein
VPESPPGSEGERPTGLARVTSFFTSVGGLLAALAAIVTAAVTITGLVLRDGTNEGNTPPGGAPPTTSAAVRAWAERTDELLYIAARLTRGTEAIRKEFAKCNQDRQQEFSDLYYYDRKTLIAQIRANSPPTPAVVTQDALISAIQREMNADSDRWTQMLFDESDSRSRCRAGDANRLDAVALGAKREFLSQYNRLARGYGLRVWTPADF